MRNFYFTLIALMFLWGACKKPDGKLSGVVTYYFNENYGDKPDVGAKINIFSKSDIDSTKIHYIQKFCSVNVYYSSLQLTNEMIGMDSARLAAYQISKEVNSRFGISNFDNNNEIKEIQKDIAKNIEELGRIWHILNEYGIVSTADFDNLSAMASDQINNVLLNNYNNKFVRKFVADGNGSYSTSLSPGEYYVIFESNHRKGHTQVDILGKIEIQKVIVEPEKEVTANINFNIN